MRTRMATSSPLLGKPLPVPSNHIFQAHTGRKGPKKLDDRHALHHFRYTYHKDSGSVVLLALP